jgi:hypothetical protein
VYVEERDAYHCEYSNDTFLRNELFWIALDDVLKTLVAHFHNDAWTISLIFDKIDDSDNHWMIETSDATDITFGCSLHLT